MKFKINRDINTLTRETFQTSNINIERLSYTTQGVDGRNIDGSYDYLIKDRLTHVIPMMSHPETGETTLRRIDSGHTREKDIFYQFSSFTNNVIPYFSHEQLRKNIKFVSKHEGVFFSFSSFELYNTLTKTKRTILFIDEVDLTNGSYLLSFDVIKREDNKMLLVFGKLNSTVKIVSLNTSQYIHKAERVLYKKEINFDENNHQGVNYVEFLKRGEIFICCANDGFIRVVETESLKIIEEYLYSDPINFFGFSEEYNIGSAVGDFSSVGIFDKTSNKLIFKGEGHTDDGFVSKFNNESNGKKYLLATGNQDITCRLWDIRKLETTAGVLTESVDVISGILNAVGNLDFIGGSEQLAIYENSDYIHVYDINNKTLQTMHFFGMVSGSAVQKETEKIYLGLSANGGICYDRVEYNVFTDDIYL